VPYYPSLDSCSEEKQADGWQLINFLDEAMWYGIDAMQVELMISRIIMHLEYTYGDRSSQDDKRCEQNFESVEQDYDARVKLYREI